MEAPYLRLGPCQGERSGSCLQDTLKPSLGVNRLFPTARLSCKQLPDPSPLCRLPDSCAIHTVTTRCLSGGAGCLLTGNPAPPAGMSVQNANNATQRQEAEVLGSLRDNRAVGNSRLAHMDVSSVSRREPSASASWHGLIHNQA